jgi:hypothetical protein
MQFHIEVPREAVTRLTSETSIRVLRTLLRAEMHYASVPPDALTISDDLTVADGGIDAEISANVSSVPTDCMFAIGLTGFQSKTGDSFKAWTLSAIKKELLDSKGRLNSEVARLVGLGGHYTLLCTGHDLTPKQRNDSKNQIIKVLAGCGVTEYSGEIRVLGATQICEYVARYPGVAKMLGIDPVQDAWVYQVWELDSHLQNAFVPSPEQSELINGIRAALSGQIKHIRLLGEPGLGKTRLVLEALREPHFAASTLYIPHGMQFGESALFRELLKATPTKPLFLVLDELPEREMSEVWRHLKSRCGYLKVISLDHSSDDTRDDEILRLHAPLLSSETIRKILMDRAGESRELDRWVGICEGSPRVAQAVGDNLRANPDDLLKSPTDVPIWERFVHGYVRRDETLGIQVDCVISHLALFSRFGYEKPVENEGVYISGLVQRVDPTIGSARFAQIVQELRAKRVLQGSKTLFFVPKALHIYLWKRFWRLYGPQFKFADLFQTMPESLHIWFMGMFKYAGEAATEHVVSDILKLDGLYAKRDFLTSGKGSRFLSTLAEANSLAVLELLERTLGKWTNEELIEFKDSRQNVVWAIEKIAVWPAHTVRAMRLLARLAVNENATNSNNATGTLLGLFRIGTEWAVTEATPQQRIAALCELLQSKTYQERSLGLNAARTALDSRGMGFRLVGPEYQGMKERAALWAPTTWEELWGARHLYFKALVDETRGWTDDIRKEVRDTLLEAVKQQITNPRCTELAFEVLEELIDDPDADASKLNDFFSDWIEHRDGEERREITQRIYRLRRKFSTHSLSSRFQRYVVDVDWLDWDQESRKRHGKVRNRAVALVDALTKRIVSRPENFREVEHLLAPSGNAPALWRFGEQIATHDEKRFFLDQLIAIALRTKHQVCLHAYLSALKPSDKELFSNTLGSMLESAQQAWLGATIALRSEYDDRLFAKCVDALAQGWIEPGQFRTLRFGKAAETVPRERMKALIRQLERTDTKSANAALIDLLDELPFKRPASFTSKQVFDIVVSTIPNEDEAWGEISQYEWKCVCEKLVKWDKKWSVPLLDFLLNKIAERFELSYDMTVAPLASVLLKSDPVSGWKMVASLLEEPSKEAWWSLTEWLKGDHPGFNESENQHAPIAAVPLQLIIDWIEQDPSARSELIARAAPRTLGDEFGGKLTRELLIKYAHIEGVASNISSVFHSGGWSGPESVYLRGRRDKFRGWLGSGYSSAVTEWVEKEMQYLDQRIRDAEINEERDHFAD